MAFDPIRGVVVLYGGTGAGEVTLDDTWTWDGQDWTQVVGAGPPPMTQHSMVFDPARGEILVVGESNGVATWRFDGAAWSLAATGGPPSATTATVAYDPATRTVLWMGYAVGAQVQWQWDGTRWQATPVTAVVAAINNAAAVTDASGPFVFGGFVKNVGPMATEQAWDGTAWHTPLVARSVLGREGMTVALDSRRRRLEVFGDTTGGPSAAEAWELAGAEWKLVSSAFPLPAQLEGVAVYDEARRATVVIKSTESTTWDGATWGASTGLLPGLLSPRLAFVPGVGDALVGAPTAGLQPVQISVQAAAGGPWNDQGFGPPTRAEFALGYEPIARKLLLFGGTSAAQSLLPDELNDTWLWDPATRVWSEASPLTQPPARSGASIAWDAARQHLVLVGGASSVVALADVWVWDRDRESWQPILVAGSPPGRVSGALPSLAVPAPEGDGIVMVRTLAFGTTTGLAVFRLRWTGPGPLEDCRGRLDLDRDGKAGCEDPDCAVTCALAAQTCGDAVCDATESTALCPGDCPARTWCGDFTCASGETPETCPGDCGMP